MTGATGEFEMPCFFWEYARYATPAKAANTANEMYIFLFADIFFRTKTKKSSSHRKKDLSYTVLFNLPLAVLTRHAQFKRPRPVDPYDIQLSQ